MKKLIKRLSMVLVAVFMFVSVLPMTAFAEGENDPSPILDSTKGVTLTIHKYAPVPDNGEYATGEVMSNVPGIKIGNVTFDVYKTTLPITSSDESKTAVTAEQVTADPSKYGVDLNNPISSLTTISEVTSETLNTFGQVTTSDLAQGVYYLVERRNTDAVKLVYDESGNVVYENGYAKTEPANLTGTVAPFLVSLPMTNSTDNAWNYDVHVYPKNYDTQIIDKDVSAPGNDNSGVNVGDDVSWYIKSKIFPEMAEEENGTWVAKGSSYVVTDILDKNLKYNEDLTVKAGETEFIKDTDYKLVVETLDTKETKITVTLTDAGKIKAVQSGEESLTISFTTEVLEGASKVNFIDNTATIDYRNESGTEYHGDSDNPEIHTGDIVIVKYDANNNALKLAGAEFGIARTMDDAKAGNFFDTATTDSEGKIRFSGLSYGAEGESYTEAETTYYIVETKAPDGYKLLKDVLEVTLKYDEARGDAQAEIILEVSNTEDFTLPITGGSGTLMFTVVGLMMVGAAAAVYFKARRVQD